MNLNILSGKMVYVIYQKLNLNIADKLPDSFKRILWRQYKKAFVLKIMTMEGGGERGGCQKLS